jgi:uncharacterized membrane protein (UPF0127 family)
MVMETLALRTQDGRWIARRLIVARAFNERLLGVLRFGALEPDAALLISPCASIHTFAVRFALDAVFLNAQLRILRLAPQIAPWRIRIAPLGTKHVLELPAGRLETLQLELGTFVCLHTGAELENNMREVTAPKRAPCERSHLRFSLRIPQSSCTHDRGRSRMRGDLVTSANDSKLHV